MRIRAVTLALLVAAPAVGQSWLRGRVPLPVRAAEVPDGFLAEASNPEGYPVFRNPEDGSRMVLVPGDSPLLVGETEVTVGQYQRFLEQAGEGVARPGLWRLQQQVPARPVFAVTWRDALAYCRWAGGRLPEDPEWAHFAGAPLRAEAYAANWNGDRAYKRWRAWDRFLKAAGSAPDDTSPFGIHDVGGSLYEWCMEHVFVEGAQEPLDSRLLRGGNFAGRRDVKVFYWSHPLAANRDIGFRLVVPLP